MGDANPIRTLGDYSKPSHEGYRNTIKLLVGNNVVPLRSDTIRLVQNGFSFHELRSEDPNQHLKDFFKLVDPLDLDEQNRNPSSPKHVHFVNSIVILNKEDEAKEEGNVKTSTTKYKDREMTMESKEEFEEETKDEIKEEEEDSPKHFDTFPTMKELRYHKWLLKNPRPPWVKAKVRTGNLNNGTDN
ncbi:hypothetical protein Tco_0477357 [Tanacetum coccineum]